MEQDIPMLCNLANVPYLCMLQDDGTVNDDNGVAKGAPSPGSVSLGTDSSEEEDDEDGDAAEHRVNVRTGEPLPLGSAVTWFSADRRC